MRHVSHIGSQLLRDEDGTFYAYTQWPSFELSEKSDLSPSGQPVANAALTEMLAATEESYP
jgi:hypothetical protein